MAGAVRKPAWFTACQLRVLGPERCLDPSPLPNYASTGAYYVIKSGDIAAKYYGKGSLYPRIFAANREVIKNPDLVYPGQKIRIPLD